MDQRMPARNPCHDSLARPIPQTVKLQRISMFLAEKTMPGDDEKPLPRPRYDRAKSEVLGYRGMKNTSSPSMVSSQS